jgi:NTP pyrophosphatase (non-canonical NTP hydrolase)
VPAKLALIHSEVSEALEAYRRGHRLDFMEEMADVMIRVLDCVSGLGMDLGPVLTRKLVFNRSHGHRHGGKRV